MGVTDVTIREAGAGDSMQIERLLAELGFPVPVDELITRLDMMANTGNRVFVAEHLGRVGGCLTTSRMEVIHRPAPVGRISMMVVEQSLRGQGIGRALVQAAQKYLTECGCFLIEVTSRSDLAGAHAFYERCGFKKTSIRLAKSIPHL